jgi:hypothetical protein
MPAFSLPLRSCEKRTVPCHLAVSPSRFRVRRNLPALSRSVSTKDSAELETLEDTLGLDEKCIGAIQFMAVDAVNESGSGHPGCPMGTAALGYVLWNEFMNFNPKNTSLFNRDRFVLSNGHASMLQYALLHLCGNERITVRAFFPT